jgi:subtilisin family serine protease
VVVPALRTVVGSREEAESLRWAADQGADVICCAWAPPRPTRESGKLPTHTGAALDYCLTRGRNGKGCVIVFSAGNDGSDLALNGYASHPGVIAVGACNCHGKHPSYSGWGDSLWCVFPSNDPRDPVGASMTYLTTAPVRSLLDGEAYYTTCFGFTSAATAAVAGICALIVSANPSLTSAEVKAALRDSCEKIDVESNTYDERGHSPLYGYGRPDVGRAVELARQRSTSAQKLGEPPHVETSMADLAVVSGTAVRPESGQPQQLSHVARGQTGLFSPRQPCRCGHHRGSEG